MIKVTDVSKKYGKVYANDSISFAVEDAQIAILLGPNGAGKSTILKNICGLLRFTGEIDICGYENHSLEAKQRIGYVPEMPALYDLLTVEEHLEFIARAYRLTDWKKYADTLMNRFELDDKKQKLAKTLSKGMQQKVSICCALLPRPRVVIFDEPMVGLDPHAIKELRELFYELKQDGASLLISTHMIDSVSDYWDITHIMNNGKIIASKTKEALMQTGEELEDLFFSLTERKEAVE